jgi:N-acetylglucosamine-6-phosphate deacetylase
MVVALTGATVFDGDRLSNGQAVLLDGPKIVAIKAERDIPAGIARVAVEGLLAPGFIDVQVNGGGGALFNDARSVEAIAAIGAAHRRFGTTGFLVTFISDEFSKMREAADVVRTAIAAGTPGLLGVHFEGPWLSAARKGIHDARFLRDFSEEDFSLLTAPGLGRVQVTLAPERVPAAVIARLVASGVVVSAGHTEADVATLRQARAAGLSGYTHLFNAMPPLAGRAPGPVGAALDDPDAYCGLIVDRRHVGPESLRIAVGAHGYERMMLVTDAMPTVGTDATGFDLYGKRIEKRGGMLVDEAGTLAGSDLDMATAVRNAADMLGLPIEIALQMASRIPAEFLGLKDRGRIAVGARADLVLLDDELCVVDSWIGGKRFGARA